jgi:ADP-ribosyl-[dinitrogen reductase] hydrolase
MTEAQKLSGMLGLLTADACGVPYEFTPAKALPPLEALEMSPPENFPRSYTHVPLGTWSDDGAQALCLWASLQACGHYHPHDFADRLLRWHDHGYCAVENYVFDIGNQTSAAIARLKAGVPPGASGLAGERNNGNGSLMRCLPLALLHKGSDLMLVIDAHRQSRLTHAHPRSEVCCALYCLWARRTAQAEPDPWGQAIQTLQTLYQGDPVSANELQRQVCVDPCPPPKGSGYVVDCLHSARWACQADSYEEVIKRAISLGNDTDTTAAVAGGIAGLRFGLKSIPRRWLNQLRGQGTLRTLGLEVPDQDTCKELALISK